MSGYNYHTALHDLDSPVVSVHGKVQMSIVGRVPEKGDPAYGESFRLQVQVETRSENGIFLPVPRCPDVWVVLREDGTGTLLALGRTNTRLAMSIEAACRDTIWLTLPPNFRPSRTPVYFELYEAEGLFGLDHDQDDITGDATGAQKYLIAASGSLLLSRSNNYAEEKTAAGTLTTGFAELEKAGKTLLVVGAAGLALYIALPLLPSLTKALR